nr:SAM-dependent methyltransferase [Saccharothrix yanglingensis]
MDTTIPSVARAYDAALGGKDDYEIDRQLLARLDAAVPEVASIALTNRKFLIRAVRYLAVNAGVQQFLDRGSGLPAAGNTHQVAQRLDSDAVVVYVDNDPVVLAHGRALLEENDNTAFIAADIFDPPQVLDHEVVRSTIDFTRPVALMQVAPLQHHPGPDPRTAVDVMRRYVEALPSGSYVVFSHFFDPEDENSEVARRVQGILNSGINRGHFRTRDEITPMLDGLQLLDPGLVVADEWWPDGPRTTLPAAGHCIVAALGVKP